MTAPLVPADCDLRGLTFMPLDVLRLRDSDLALVETPETFKASVLLWCSAWHQTPAGSLPNDDRVLNRLSGLDPKAWKRARAAILGEWVECDDGRLYHPVVAEKALEAWKERQKYRQKRDQDRDRLKDWREKKQTAGGDGNAPRNATETPRETRFETPKTVEGQDSGGKGDSSEPNGSGADGAAPVDVGKDCWRMAKLLLAERDGLTGDRPGKVFGKILSDYSLSAAEMFPAVAAAAANGTQDMTGYLTKSAQRIAGQKGGRLTASERALRSNIQ